MQSIDKCSFILRLWRVEHSEAATWLASLEIPETGKRIGFANLEQLFSFLMDLSERNECACTLKDLGENGSGESL